MEASKENALRITSWSKQGFYELDWGTVVGTKIERVRICGGSIVKNVAIIMPELKSSTFEEQQCGLEVIIFLERLTMRRLKRDPLFNRFAQYKPLEPLVGA